LAYNEKVKGHLLVFKNDSCAFKNESPLTNFKSSQHSPFLLEVHVSYTVEVLYVHLKFM